MTKLTVHKDTAAQIISEAQARMDGFVAGYKQAINDLIAVRKETKDGNPTQHDAAGTTQPASDGQQSN